MYNMGARGSFIWYIDGDAEIRQINVKERIS